VEKAMPGFGDIVQKAFYLGVGAASYAAEKAGLTLSELRVQAQKIADEMVARGEMTTEEAKRMVDEMVSRAQQEPAPSEPAKRSEPRRIEILVEDEPDTTPETASQQSTQEATQQPASQEAASQQPASQAEDLRQQVAKLQEELRRLQQD
jgi:polyhydroxyalkanoate synthesis regulator phasin